MPPGQHEDEDGTIVNPGGNVAPGLNRGDKIDKPDNPNKPDKPENPGTEDKDDKKANKANKGTHIYTYDELNRMVSSEIAKELTNYTYDTLGNLVLETVKNKSVDYEYNELNQLVRKTTSNNEVYTYSYDKRGNCAGAERRLRRMQRGGGGAKKGAGKPPSARRRTRLFLTSGLPRPARRHRSPSCMTPPTAWWRAPTGRATSLPIVHRQVQEYIDNAYPNIYAERRTTSGDRVDLVSPPVGPEGGASFWEVKPSSYATNFYKYGLLQNQMSRYEGQTIQIGKGTYTLYRGQNTIAPGAFESTIYGVDIIVNYWNPRPGEVYYTFQPVPKKEPAYVRVPLTIEGVIPFVLAYLYAQWYYGGGADIGLDTSLNPVLSYFDSYDSCLPSLASLYMASSLPFWALMF